MCNGKATDNCFSHLSWNVRNVVSTYRREIGERGGGLGACVDSRVALFADRARCRGIWKVRLYRLASDKRQPIGR